MTLGCQYAMEWAISLNSTYMHWNLNIQNWRKKGTISQSINFQMHVVMIKGICPILLYCVSFITLAMVGLLNEWKPIICNACSTWSFFCTLVIIIIVICEQGGRTHNGTFVGGGHGRWSYHWVMSFDPTPLSSVKASLS